MTHQEARLLANKFKMPIAAEGRYVCNVCEESWHDMILEEWTTEELEIFFKGNGCPECA